MTAKEKFEKLGFDLDIYEYNGEEFLEYSFNDVEVIEFNKTKRIYKIFVPKINVSIEIHQAITQQMKELGWIE